MHTCFELTSFRADVSLPPGEAIDLLQILKIDNLGVVLRCSNLEELVFCPSGSVPAIRDIDGSIITVKGSVNRGISSMERFKLGSC
jgi:hypothetical protein